MHQVFRASDGTKANEDARLTIPLTDFGIEVPREAKVIEIRCAEIFELVVAAEAKQSRKRLQERERGTPPYKRIRREPLSSSPEQMQKNREEGFRQAESFAEEKADKQSDYEASLSEGDAQFKDKEGISSRLRARRKLASS